MGGEWRELPLGEVIELKRGYDLPAHSRKDGKIPIVSSSGPSGFHNESMAKAPGVVTGRYGTIGQVFYIQKDFWPLNTTLYVKDFKGNDPRFISYLLSTLNFQAYSDKAAVPGINRNHIHKEIVNLPPLSEQRRIAGILGALDDKIELNRKMNRTLEDMAQAIFKSWFIDFDGHTDFEDSPLGTIPKGWKDQAIFEQAKFINGAAPKGNDLNTEGRGIPVVKIAELKNGVTGQTKFTEIELAKKHRIDDGEVLFSWSGNPDTSIGIFVWVGGEGWLNQHIWRVLTSDLKNHFVFFLLKYLNPIFTEIARNKQTTGLGHVTVQDLKRLTVVVPPPRVLRQFNEIAAPLFERWYGNLLESRTLNELRETLLPKLIGCEDWGSEVENTMEGVH